MRKIAPISAPIGRYCMEALAQLREIDVQHHHHEEEQHGDGADIDDHQDHRQELGSHQHEQAGRVDEGEDEEEYRRDRVARGDDHERGRDRDTGEQVEEGCGCTHAIMEISRPEDGPFCLNSNQPVQAARL